MLKPLLAAVFVAASAWQPQALAQDFPNRPITLTIGYPAGGSADTGGRLIATAINEMVGRQLVIVQNKPGANGAIAAQSVMAAKPDGYTLHLANIGTLSLPLRFKALADFDPINALAPISILIYQPLIVLVPANSPATNLRDFITYAKANPGRLNWAGVGGGNAIDLAAYLNLGGVLATMQMIPYSGNVPARTALAAGEVMIAADTPASALPMINSGKIRPIGILASKPWPAMPSLQMTKDLFPSYGWGIGYQGLEGPKGMPEDVVAKLSAMSRAAVNRPEAKKRFADISITVDDGGPDELRRQAALTFENWKKNWKLSGVPVQ